MALEFEGFLSVRDLVGEKGMGYDSGDCLVLPNGGKVRGLALPKNATGSAAYTGAGYTAVCALAGAPAKATGNTFKVYLTDDGTSAADLGTVVRIGITLKRLVNDETIDIDANAAAEVTADVTLSATSLGIAVGTIAIANAAEDSLGVGEAYLIRVRRVGTASQDTCPGRVVLHGVLVLNT